MLEDIVVGKTIGNKNHSYKIIRDPEKSGAFGKVFVARNIKSGEEVAVKVLKDELTKTKNVQDFIREGKLTQAIPKHKNIVETYDAGFDSKNNLFYIAMELMKYDLNEYLSSVNYDFNSIKQIIFDVGEALVHSHSKDIIFCDIHRGNILFGKNGVVKLADFGLAEIKRDSDFFKKLSKKDAIESACLNLFSEEDENESGWDKTGILDSGKARLRDIAIPAIAHSAPEVLAGMVKGNYRKAISKSSDIYSFAHLSVELLELVNDTRLKKVLEKSINGRISYRHDSMAELVSDMKNYDYYVNQLKKFYTHNPKKQDDVIPLKQKQFDEIYKLAEEAKKDKDTDMGNVVNVLKNIERQQAKLYGDILETKKSSYSENELSSIRKLCHKMRKIQKDFGLYK